MSEHYCLVFLCIAILMGLCLFGVAVMRFRANLFRQLRETESTSDTESTSSDLSSGSSDLSSDTSELSSE